MWDNDFIQFVKDQNQKKRRERMFRKYVFAIVVLGLAYMVICSFPGCTEVTQQTRPTHFERE